MIILVSLNFLFMIKGLKNQLHQSDMGWWKIIEWHKNVALVYSHKIYSSKVHNFVEMYLFSDPFKNLLQCTKEIDGKIDTHNKQVNLNNGIQQIFFTLCHKPIGDKWLQF